MSGTKKTIEVVPYNPEWPAQFEAESAKIKQALGENLIAVHHVGSTSIPGLLAKPKIDIIAVVKDPKGSISSLEVLGYEYKGEYNIPLHYGFAKRKDGHVNLHVYEEGNAEIELNLLFRDYLRKHPELRDEYAQLKRSLLEDPASHEKNNRFFAEYTVKKGAFIHTVLKKAGFNRLRMLICSDDSEWKAVRLLHDTYCPGTDLPRADSIQLDDASRGTTVVLLYKGVSIIGYAHLEFLSDEKALVRTIVIDEAYREQGCREYFLSRIEQWLKAVGYGIIEVEPS
jgi:GrpB-like predicted nucleotidyltransferase (UPF0157 family)